MRIPLAVNLESRDGGVGRDAKVLNGIVESRGQDVPPTLYKRPGVADQGLIAVGAAQLLYNWNGIKAILGDSIYSGTVSTIVSAPTSTALSPLLSTVTLNPSDKNAGVTLTNGNLTAASGTSYRGVRGTLGKSSGKWYWEVTIVSADCLAGVGTATATLADLVGGDANGHGLYFANGNHYTSGSPAAYTSSFAAGSTVGFGLDMDAGTLTIYRAGVSQGSMATGLSGTYFPMVSPNATATMTVNFGASAFAATVPTGYTALGASTYVSGLQFTAVETNPTAATPYLFFKTSRQAFVINRSGTVSTVTYASSMGAGTYTLTSLTRSGTTATATLSDDVVSVGDSVTIAGASPSNYNGTVTVTATTTGVAAYNVALTITLSGATATATTTTPHGLTNGSSYAISGASNALYNGTFTVTVLTSTTFTYTITVTSPATGSPVLAATKTFNVTNYTGLYPGTPLIGGSYTNIRATTADGAAHGLSNGATVHITTGGTSSSGVSHWADSDTITISNVTATTFDFTVAAQTNANNVNGSGVTLLGLPSVSSITNAALVATVTTGTTIPFSAAWTIAISGAVQTAYNISTLPTLTSGTTFTYSIAPGSPASGAPIVAVPAVNPTFTYAVAGSPTTPATGTITAQGGGGTVPGCPYIDGYISVMDTNGVIWHCAADNPTSWPALTFLTARNENGKGVALGKSLNYLVAWKEYSTEYYFDNSNPSGSPFSPVDNGFTRTGCASGPSVARVSNSHCWISQIREGNRSVHRMDGLQQREIATPDICRILNADTLATVYAFGIDLKGHPLYLLTLPGSNITLVYDLISQFWTQWTSLTLGSQVSVSSITLSGTTATVTTSSAHGLNDGDPVKISGAAQSAYNSIFQAFVLTTTTFNIYVTGSPVTPATGTIIMKPYTETYFKFIKEATYNGSVYFLHESDGHLYQMLPTLYQDAGIPINAFARSVRIDGGDDDQKKLRKIRFIGDLATDIAGLRFSDDDNGTFTPYRLIALDQQPSEIRKCGGFRRRSVEFRHVGNTPLRGEALELEIAK